MVINITKWLADKKKKKKKTKIAANNAKNNNAKIVIFSQVETVSKKVTVIMVARALC